MAQLTTEMVLEYCDQFRPKQRPTGKDVYNPNFEMYAQARYWTIEQAVCLLGGISTVDRATFLVLVGTDELRRMVKKVLVIVSGREPAFYSRFSDYVLYEFPIDHHKMVHLNNIHQALLAAIKSGRLPTCRTTLLPYAELVRPSDVLEALRDTMAIPPRLSEAIMQQSADPMRLREIFPNEIEFEKPWLVNRIKRNVEKPWRIGATAGASFADTNAWGMAVPEAADTTVDSKSSPGQCQKNSSDSTPEGISTEEGLGRGKFHYDTAHAHRLLALELCLSKDSEPNQPLPATILEYAQPPKLEVYKHSKNRLPPYFTSAHRCRAIGQYLRARDPMISIPEMYRHPHMQQFGLVKKPITSLKTFRKWLNQEGLFDRPTSAIREPR